MLPFVPPLQTEDLNAVGGRIGEDPADFFVEEIPAYEPSGEGEHTYVFVEKRERNTRDVAQELAHLADVPLRDVGFAGMKDKQAVTRQWFSLPRGASKETLTGASFDGFRILTLSAHNNKLRTGHLIGNRFRIRLRDVPEGGLARAKTIAERLTKVGLDNYFGPQRFGREGRNLDTALDWLRGDTSSPPAEASRRKGRRGKQRGPDPKMLSSVLQSEIFNRFAARRLALCDQLLEGDVVRLSGTGSHFIVDSVEAEAARFSAGDLLLTGPMIGPKGLQARGAARALEDEVVDGFGLTEQDLQRLGRAAPGARRDLRLHPEELEVTEDEPGTLTLAFRLPAGAFATQLMREFSRTAWDSPRTAL